MCGPTSMDTCSSAASHLRLCRSPLQLQAACVFSYLATANKKAVRHARAREGG